MVSQLSIFLTNDKGRLASACRTLADAGISMHSLFVADTAEYGVVRIFCDTPNTAAKVLKEAGYRASVTSVLALKVPNEKGGLATVLEYLDSTNVNIEYCYCVSVGLEVALVALRVDETESDVEVTKEGLASLGFEFARPEEIYTLD